ncbi:L-aspartate oxidase [Paracoccus onchidii]
MINTNRVVIVGAGLAALYAALKLAPRPVLMISPDPLGQGASSGWAQGGVAAAMDRADSAEAHARDTLRAGAGSVDPAIARMVTEEARTHILDLTRLGTPFDRRENGDYVLSREAAHSFARVVRVRGDQAGAEIMRALIAQAGATSSIQVLEGVVATGLIRSANRVQGVRIARSNGSQTVTIDAPAVLLAGGGSGGLFAVTTNPPRIRGEVIGMAARAGAIVADAEFVQFHPTAIDCGVDPAPLATEALRGEGAHLINAAGERFMIDVHPDAELAPRDVVARAIYAQWRQGQRPMLDTRACLGQRIIEEFPAVANACLNAGIDPVREPIPVAAAAHYHMGGIAVAANGRASLEGLWVCGEASSTGLHGANRLASNGLLEALVFGRICALDIRHSVTAPEQDEPPVVLPDLQPGPTAQDDLVQELRKVMTAGAGVVRNGTGLRNALREIARIESRQSDCETLLNMTATATLICAAALERRESRGAHYRDDFPDQINPAIRSRMTLDTALAMRDALLSEDV